MAPRQRNKQNKRYPKNWRLRKTGNRYYISFRCPQISRHLWGGKAEPLLGKGNTVHEAEQQAYKAWSDRIAVTGTPDTMGSAFDRYEAEVIPEKAPATQKSNLYSMRRLRAVIPADMPVVQFRTNHAYQYRDQCAQKESPKKANLDLEVLSHLFTKCLEWGTPGLIEHPVRGKVKKIYIPPRDRYVEDWEYDEFHKVCGPMLSVYLPLKYALGLDKNMILRIKLPDIKEDRLCFQKRTKIKNNPKAKKKDYLFEDEAGSTGLRELIDDVLVWRKKHVRVLSPYLFCTSMGEPYIQEDGETSTFDSNWQRKMKKALAETKLKVRFTEHDICAKTASDLETTAEAQKLRGHLNIQTTETVYRRKPQKVIPLKGRGNGKECI